jgi:hypothetical protein
MELKCAEYLCATQKCAKQSFHQFKNCTKNDCCCFSFHQQPRHFSSVFDYLQPLRGLNTGAVGIETLCIIALSNFKVGLGEILSFYEQCNLKCTIRTSLIIVITSESICFLGEELVDLIFYKYSILLSVPFALLASAFTVVPPEAYRKMKSSSQRKSQ